MPHQDVVRWLPLAQAVARRAIRARQVRLPPNEVLALAHLGLIEGLARLRPCGDAQAAAYLRTRCFGAIIDGARRAVVREAEHVVQSDIPAYARPPDVLFAEQELYARVERALARLTANQLAVLRVVYGFTDRPASAAELAAHSGVSVCTVYRIQRQAIAALRRLLGLS